MAVGKFHLPKLSGSSSGGSSSGGNLTPEPYVRPVDWLSIDSLVNSGDQKVVILAAVFEESNFVAVQCQGNYTVNWGDGTVTNYSSNTIAYYKYDWNYSGFSGTTTSRGYKQAIITITPQAGQNLTLVRLNVKHNQSGLTNAYTNPWLDIKMSGSLISTLTIGTTAPADPLPRLLEQFDWIGSNNLTNVNNMFNGANVLKQVKNLNTSTSNNFTSFFAQCYELEHIPFFDTSNGTNFNSMFINCYKLKSVPLYNFSNSIQFVSTFSNCVSIVEFPNFNCISGNLFSNMFDGCRSMLKTPSLVMNTSSKGLGAMFANCFSMIEFVNINTGNGTVYSLMFQNCYSLQKIPTTINTTTSSTNVGFRSMFQNCYNLETAPNIDLSKGGDCSGLFTSCWSIKEFPAYNFSSATSLNSAFSGCFSLKKLPVMTIGTSITSFNSCFSGCTSLEEAPNWNLQNVIDVTNMFNGCSNLRKVPAYNLTTVTVVSSLMFANCTSLIESNVTGMTRTHSYANCKLSRTELVKIFNNLGTAVGAQTITITGNYGASTLTAGERAIATGKGWTILG